MPYLYLHGFASGPGSTKAQALQRRFQTQGLELIVPDLNQGNFHGLTLSRQIQQARRILESQPGPWGMIGSSFGGLTAAWLGSDPQLSRCIGQMVLLAPALRFLDQWLPRLGAPQLQLWQDQQMLKVYHYGAQTYLPLAYSFLLDAQGYDDRGLQPRIPTLILHGCQDEVINIQVSRDFAAHHDNVELVELESDHALGDVEEAVWEAVREFLQLS